MNKNHNLYTIKEAIDKLLHTYRLDTKMAELDVINSWKKVMGNMIAKHTTDIRIVNKELYVRLDSAALRHELSLGKEKIVDLLNKEAGGKVVERIVLL